MIKRLVGLIVLAGLVLGLAMAGPAENLHSEGVDGMDRESEDSINEKCQNSRPDPIQYK